MKTKMFLAIFFSAFFTLNSFAKTFKVIYLKGTVTVTVAGKTQNLTYNGQEFTANTPSSELGLGDCSAYVTFSEKVKNAPVQTASRNCTRNRSTTSSLCTGPNCRPDNTGTAIVPPGNRRDELDAFLIDGRGLTDIAIADLHSVGLQAVTIQQQQEVKFNAGKMQPVDAVKNTTISPNATRMKAPAIDKAAIKVRQQ